jgi:hypothetical protein
MSKVQAMSAPTNDEPTIGRLVADASRDISTLVSKEIELAKSELKVSVTAAGAGAALFVVAGALLLMALVLLSITAAYFINWDGDGLALKWSFLIVTGAWLLLAGLMAVIGIRVVKKIKAPEKTIEEGHAIVETFKR